MQACISKSLLSHKALLQGTVLQGSYGYVYRSLLKSQGSVDILTYRSAAGGMSGGGTGMGRRWERELVVGYGLLEGKESLRARIYQQVSFEHQQVSFEHHQG